MAAERLQKLIAQAGVCSRRRAEELLRDGRVTVNGQRAQLGDKADPNSDAISLDGQPLGGRMSPHLMLGPRLSELAALVLVTCLS